MDLVSRFLTNKLRLKVNEAKSAVARPEERKFLGFSISNDGSERRIAPKALDKFKDANPGNHVTDTRSQFGAVGRRPHAIPHRMARLLRLLPDAARAYEPGCVDPPETAIVSLAAMEERAEPLHGAPQTSASPSSRQRSRPVHRPGLWRMSGHPAVQHALRNSYFDSLGLPESHARAGLTRSNRRGTDPYARWCGRGGVARRPPIPISGPSRHIAPPHELGRYRSKADIGSSPQGLWVHALERDENGMNCHRAPNYCLRMISAQTLRVCREGKPLHTFQNYALENIPVRLGRILGPILGRILGPIEDCGIPARTASRRSWRAARALPGSMAAGGRTSRSDAAGRRACRAACRPRHRRRQARSRRASARPAASSRACPGARDRPAIEGLGDIGKVVAFGDDHALERNHVAIEHQLGTNHQRFRECRLDIAALAGPQFHDRYEAVDPLRHHRLEQGGLVGKQAVQRLGRDAGVPRQFSMLVAA